MKAFVFVLKLTLFSLLIVIVANLVQWNGRTLSDQIKTHMSSVERMDLVNKARTWAKELTEDARKGAGLHNPGTIHQIASEEISGLERQKLRALIRDLNQSH